VGPTVSISLMPGATTATATNLGGARRVGAETWHMVREPTGLWLPLTMRHLAQPALWGPPSRVSVKRRRELHWSHTERDCKGLTIPACGITKRPNKLWIGGDQGPGRARQAACTCLHGGPTDRRVNSEGKMGSSCLKQPLTLPLSAVVDGADRVAKRPLRRWSDPREHGILINPA
jgi:hypothetical protein